MAFDKRKPSGVRGQSPWLNVTATATARKRSPGHAFR